MQEKKYHIKKSCHHCGKELVQRQDTVKRQMAKYGHSCCKNCFGKEISFRDARKRIMLTDNPFKGKRHTKEFKEHLSKFRIENKYKAWNKGLTKETNSIVKQYALSSSRYKKENPLIGDKNPNWKGGISDYKNYWMLPHELHRWLTFRKVILERDYYTCWNCKSKKRPEVHHLVSKKRYPELLMEPKNCITLCHDCHIEFHKQYGKRKFEADDTVIWINSQRKDYNKLVLC